MLDTVPLDAASARRASALLGLAAGATDRLAPISSTSGRIAFEEPGESFMRLALRNFALTLATLGVYHFWGRIAVKQRLMGALRIDGARLTYTGSGLGGLVTFAVAMAMTAPVILLALDKLGPALTEGGGGGGIPMPTSLRAQRLVLSLPLMFLFGSIVYRRRTHLLRRLLLDGARFDQTGNAWAYAVRHVLTAFAVPATLGWAGPWRMQRLSTRLVREMTFDGRPFSYSGSARALYRPFVTLWLGGVGLYLATLLALGTTIGADIIHAAEIGSIGPLLSLRVAASGVPILATGLLSFAVLARAYRAEVLNNHVSHIAWGATRFKLSVPPVDYAMVSLAGSALRVLTLGVLSPVADAQMWRLMARHLDIEGPPLTARRD